MRSRDTAHDIVPPFAPGPPSTELPAALRAAHEQIVADLRATQGAWRDRPWPARFAPLVAAVVVAAAPWAVMAPQPASLAGLLAIGSCLLAFIAVATATQAPMRGSILGTAGLLVGAGAVVLEGFSRGDLGVAKPPLVCALMQAAFFLPPAVLLGWHLRRARLPARAGHAAAVGGAGLLGCALIWSSCLDGHLIHRVFEHSVGAAVLMVAGATLARTWWRRPRAASAS